MATAHSKAFERVVQAISSYISDMANASADLEAIKKSARAKFEELKPDDLSTENTNLWDQYTRNFFNVLDTFSNKETALEESVPADEIIQQTPLPAENEVEEITRFVASHPTGPAPNFEDLMFQQEGSEGGEVPFSVAAPASSSNSSNVFDIKTKTPAVKKRTAPTTVSTPEPASIPAPVPVPASPQKKPNTAYVIDDDDDDVKVISQQPPKKPKSPQKEKEKEKEKETKKKDDDAMDVDEFEDIFVLVDKEEQMKKQKAEAEQLKAGAKRLHGESAAKKPSPITISDSDDDSDDDLSESSDDAARIKPPSGAKGKVSLAPPKGLVQPPSASKKSSSAPSNTKKPSTVTNSENKPAEPKKSKISEAPAPISAPENIMTPYDTEFSMNVYDVGIKGRFNTRTTRFYVITDTTPEGNPERIKWWQQVRPSVFTNVISYGKSSLRGDASFEYEETTRQVLILMKAETEANSLKQLTAAFGKVRPRQNWVILHCFADQQIFKNKDSLNNIPFFSDGNWVTTKLRDGVYQTASEDVQFDNPNTIAEQFRSMRI